MFATFHGVRQAPSPWISGKVSYEAHLPCFKQGDDLASAMESHPTDLAAAFTVTVCAFEADRRREGGETDYEHQEHQD